MKPIILFVLTTTSIGCSNNDVNQFLYEAHQPYTENECTMVKPQERDGCMLDAQKRISYEKYIEEKQAIVKP